MNKKETLATRYGEMLDMIDCRDIDRGKANLKKKMSFDEVMNLR